MNIMRNTDLTTGMILPVRVSTRSGHPAAVDGSSFDRPAPPGPAIPAAKPTPHLKNVAARAFLAGGLGLAVMGLGAWTANAAPAAPTAAVAPDQLALATLNDIVQGDDSAAAVNFDQTMQQKLPAAALGQAWTAYQQQFGPYQSHGDPQDVQRGDITVVNVPLQMQREPGQFRLSVHPDGTIAGLFFLKEGVPVP